MSTILLPAPGDIVEHSDVHGRAMVGRVFQYRVSDGTEADGDVSVVL